jgi:competence protein ComEC
MQKVFIGSICSFAIGVSLQTMFAFPLAGAVWLMLLGLVVALLWRKRSSASSALVLLSVSFCLTFASLGLLRAEVFSWQFGVSDLEASVGQTIEIEGVVVVEPDYKPQTVQIYIETGSDKVLVTTDRHTEIVYGDKVLVKGKLEKPTSFETDLGRTFDYVGYLLARKVEYRMSFAKVEVTEPNSKTTLTSVLLQGKSKFISSIKEAIPEPEVGLGSGLLLGVKSALGEDIEEDFRRTGIIHIVVLSGYNVMLVVAFILFIFSFFLPMRWRFAFGLLAIVSFALLVGLSATVVRASIMVSLVLFAQSFGRQYDILSGLFLAGFVMLVVNPYLLLYDIGFQLSFMATLGLILIVPYFEASLMLEEKKIKGKEFLLSTIATQIAVLPLLMYHIGQVSLVAVFVNLLVLPIVPVAMFMTFITGMVGLLSVSIASLLGYITSFVLWLIIYIAQIFSELPFASVLIPEFSGFGVLLSYIAMTGIYFYLKRNKISLQQDEYRDWEIVEEEEKVGSESEPTPNESKENLPIFFR